jgi:hypothetical protein
MHAKTILFVAAVTLATPIFGQEAPTVETVTTQVNETIAALREQRARAEDREVQTAIALAQAQRELAHERAENAALKLAVY